MTAVRHNEAQTRYELDTEHGMAVAVYRQQGDALVFVHTEVPPEDEGKGIGAQVVRAALDDSRLRGRSVPIAAPIGRHARLAAIVGGTRLLGGLIVLDVAPLSDVAIRTLERSAMVMAFMQLAPPWTAEAQAADSAQGEFR